MWQHNTLRLRQNGRHFPANICKWIFLNKNVWIFIKISLTLVPSGPINIIPALVQIMAWCPTGAEPLSGPMMAYSLLTHTCVSQPQRVNKDLGSPRINRLLWDWGKKLRYGGHFKITFLAFWFDFQWNLFQRVQLMIRVELTKCHHCPGDDLVTQGNKLLPEPMLTQDLCHHMASLSHYWTPLYFNKKKKTPYKYRST